MHRLSAPISEIVRRALCAGLLVAAFLLPAVPVRAQGAPSMWFAGTRLIFERAQTRDGEVAVPVADPGLQRFLNRLGAVLAYAPGQRYIAVTTADRRTVTFTLGDTHVSTGGVVTSTPFAPYEADGDVYLPFLSLARALYVQPIPDGNDEVLQPQFGGLDVRTQGKTTLVTLHAALPVSVKRVAPGRVSLTFPGIGSALDQNRIVGGPGLNAVDVLVSGEARNPTTTVTFETPAGASHAFLANASRNDVTLAFAPAGVALNGSAASAQPVPAPPLPATPVAGADSSPDSSGRAAPAAAAPVTVTGVALQTGDDGASTVQISVDGSARFEWHRLLDGRWYVDIQNAQLGMPARDDAPNQNGILSMRVRQFARAPIPIVRISLSLASSRRVDATANGQALTVTVAAADDPSPDRTGVGAIGDQSLAAAPPPATPNSSDGAWKFTPPAPTLARGTNARLIVIDPGHGGSDPGAAHNGLTEKDLTLDLSRRLRSILVSRGWTVKMTRDSDTDVFAPNDSAHDELQARDDIANGAGARMLISIHINSYVNGSLRGTTTYYYKQSDLLLAQALHRRLAAALESQDDGIRKDNLYVIHHAAMPASLVETAFLSNPADAELLKSSQFLQKVATAIADGVSDYAALPAKQSDASYQDTGP